MGIVSENMGYIIKVFMIQIFNLFVPTISGTDSVAVTGDDGAEFSILPYVYEIYTESQDDGGTRLKESINTDLTFVNGKPSGIVIPSGFITIASGWISLDSLASATFPSSGSSDIPSFPGISGGPYASGGSGTPILLGYNGSIFTTVDINLLSSSGYYMAYSGLPII